MDVPFVVGLLKSEKIEDRDMGVQYLKDNVLKFLNIGKESKPSKGKYKLVVIDVDSATNEILPIIKSEVTKEEFLSIPGPAPYLNFCIDVLDVGVRNYMLLIKITRPEGGTRYGLMPL
jgi:hypothetical protein